MTDVYNPMYYGEPLQRGNYVYGMEKVAEMAMEVRHLHEEHYSETETAYMDHQLDPDYERLIETEKRGQFIIFTARDLQRNLVGDLMYYVSRSVHVKTVFQAKEDAFFVTAEHRKNNVGQHLLEYAEQELADLGVTYIGMSSKEPVGGPDLDEFMRKNNYRRVAVYYQKRLPNAKLMH